MTRLLRLGAAILLGAIAVIVLPVGPVSSASSVDLSASSAAPGTAVVVSGSCVDPGLGLAPGPGSPDSWVSVRLSRIVLPDSPPGSGFRSTARYTVAADGTFVHQYFVPAAAPPGSNYQFSVSCGHLDAVIPPIAVPFEVSDEPPAVLEVAGAPEPGATLAVSVTRCELAGSDLAGVSFQLRQVIGPYAVTQNLANLAAPIVAVPVPLTGGAASGSLTLPSDLAAGDYVVIGLCADASGGVAMITTMVHFAVAAEVVVDPPEPPTVTPRFTG